MSMTVDEFQKLSDDEINQLLLNGEIIKVFINNNLIGISALYHLVDDKEKEYQINVVEKKYEICGFGYLHYVDECETLLNFFPFTNKGRKQIINLFKEEIKKKTIS